MSHYIESYLAVSMRLADRQVFVVKSLKLHLLYLCFFVSVFFYVLAPVPTVIAKRYSEDFSSNASK